MFVIIKTRANSLWANNLPLFDDDKTHGVIDRQKTCTRISKRVMVDVTTLAILS